MSVNLDVVVETAIRGQDALLAVPIDTSRGRSTPLFSEQSAMDSITLVSIIVDIESRIKGILGKDIMLADISDLPEGSQPFSTIGTLISYIETRVSQL
ncbi:hypothetical protein BGP78_09765 [Pseudoalteromonas sp. MSK9-3]|uniref:hypothetical protein n=1 Tax=Pseudoalteromonas sp. MSK9-3 TaxID=1897633 RepID=UPI000E6B8157|nr:hypothetical protein [Pseudoalteromonas sp. MSK9-3]RJE77178.1 hypothetical protein BGP78_09765 [Pseudoalteromonas sp. MSK9-3]